MGTITVNNNLEAIYGNEVSSLLLVNTSDSTPWDKLIKVEFIDLLPNTENYTVQFISRKQILDYCYYGAVNGTYKITEKSASKEDVIKTLNKLINTTDNLNKIKSDGGLKFEFVDGNPTFSAEITGTIKLYFLN